MRTKPFLLLLAGGLLLLSGCRSSRGPATPSEAFHRQPWTGPKTDTLLSGLLQRQPEWYDSLLRQNSQWRIQIIYTKIDRTAKNKPVFSHFYYNADPSAYFYPASTVKMPVSFLALQKAHELQISGLDANTTMVTDSAFAGETRVYNEPSSMDGRPTLAHYIKKIFLISDNDAFNRLYEFLGQDYINSRLQEMGYDSVQIVHRLSVPLTEAQNRHTNPVSFYDSAAHRIYQQPLQIASRPFQPRYTKMGRGYLSAGKLVSTPMDFSSKNRISLVDLHSMLLSVIFPSAVPERQRFRLSEEDYRFLYRYMSMKPAESDYPPYAGYDDAYVKFLMYGGDGKMPDSSIRIFNKVGDAYGFATDVAYVVDFKNKVEFLLSATIYCNSDGVFNDDRYDYNTVGFPFLKHLGQTIYQYELGRKRKQKPDLSSMQFTYGR